jgi:DNA primase catalytic core
MARIPEAELARLKAEVSVERLAEASGVKLRRSGRDLVGQCPFHDDATASLTITPEKNLFHCFGCGAAGGPVDWTMRRQGVSFRHAAELLREGAPAPGEGAKRVEGVKRTTARALASPLTFDADDRALLAQVVDYYHRTLRASPEALDYLAARGLNDPDLIERFRLGYANRTLGLRLPDKARKAGAEVRARLERLGVYRASGHEHLNGSLVVPIFDESGAVSGLYGRKIRDDLRPGTAKHLYLPGPHRGVWNASGLRGSREAILCEALIDAMTFWCAGHRNVTAAYGVEGFTGDHLAAFKAAGIERVLIAYDRDEAGERGAAEQAQRLRGEGFEPFRIQFPHGLDANAYALKVKPAAQSLGLLIRTAEWRGEGKAPARGKAPASGAQTTPGADVETALAAPVVSSLAAESPPPPLKAPPQDQPPQDPRRTAPVDAPAPPRQDPPPLPAARVPEGPAEISAQASETEVALSFGERRYRVRGLARNLACDVLKINLLASAGDAFHVDTLDLYNARARAGFVTEAALALGLAEEVVKADLGRVLRKLEELQEAAIAKALAPKPPPPEMSEAAREAALAWLRSPDLTGRIVADFAACGLVGEETNALVAYLAAVSRKLAAPLALVIQSSSAAGKSALMEAALAFVPADERVQYSAMTGQSLFYMGETDLKHRILAIAEEEGASRAAYALKLLQSEGELTIASTGSDPKTGALVTRQYRVEGPTMLMMTTTAIDLDEELLNRCLILTVDEDRAQTQAIHRRQRAKRTLAGLGLRQERQALIALHRDAQRLLRPLAVVNPYADRLTFLDDRTRTRRDHEKYLTLIDALALMHQHQRPVKATEIGAATIEYVEATLDDIAAANRLAHEILGRGLDDLPPQTRRVLGGVADHVAEEARRLSLARGDVRFSRADIRRRMGLADTQCRLHLDRLAALEYLLVHRGRRGQSFEYELLYDGDLAKDGPHLAGLIDVDALRSAQSPATTPSSRGREAGLAGPSRAHGGPIAAPSRAPDCRESDGPAEACDATPAQRPESRPLGLNGEARSYPPLSSLAASA